MDGNQNEIRRRQQRRVFTWILVGLSALILLCLGGGAMAGVFSSAKSTLLVRNSDVESLNGQSPEVLPTITKVMPVQTRVLEDGHTVTVKVEEAVKAHDEHLNYNETYSAWYAVDSTAIDPEEFNTFAVTLNLPDVTASYRFKGYIVAGVDEKKRRSEVVERDGKIIVIIHLPAANMQHVVIKLGDVEKLDQNVWAKVFNASAQAFIAAGTVVESKMIEKACSDQVLQIARAQEIENIQGEYADMKAQYANVEIQVDIPESTHCP